MRATKTVEVEVDTADVRCDECGKRQAETALCATCLTDVEERAGDHAIENYTPPEDEMRADAAERVRSWLTTERHKPGCDLTADMIRVIERLAEDLEVG